MNIVFFYQYFGTPKGSWSTRVYELTRRWVAAGHKVTVVTAPYEKSDIKTDKFICKRTIEGINLIIINSGDSNKWSKLKRVFRAIRFAIVSVRYAMFLKYDVLLASSGPITIGIPLIFAKLFRTKKTIFEVRDLWPAGGIEMGLIKKRWQQRFALWFERICYKYSDLIVTASIGQKEYIMSRHNLSEIAVIPNASDVDLFNVDISNQILPNYLQGKALFTHIGSLGLIHNTMFWLDVANELKLIDVEKRIVLLFIGDGADKKMLIERKESEELDNVIFLGLRPKDELPFWVKKSYATLFATLNNAVQDACSPNKIFDSFAAGVPIIQTSNGWIRKLVEESNCGVNVSLDDPKGVADRILWLSSNLWAVKEMGHNSFKLAEGRFNREYLSNQYLNYIETVYHGNKIFADR